MSSRRPEKTDPPTISFIAAPPLAKGVPIRDAPAAEQPDFITSVIETLRGFGVIEATRGDKQPDTGHFLVPAPDLPSIDKWLNEYLHTDMVPNGRTVRVQFIGHAVPGRLLLGESWLIDKSASKRFPYYAIDSNPHALALFPQYRGRIDEVVFAGCDVGEWVTNKTAITGRVLLFTFAEMLRCKVRGAVGIIKGKDFEDGWYGGPRAGWAWNRRAKTPQHVAGAAPPKPKTINDIGSGLELPSAGSIDGVSLSNTDLATLSNYFDGRLDEDLNLAAHEMSVSLTFGDRSYEGHLLSGGRFFSLTRDGQTTVHANTRGETDAFADLLARIRWRGQDPRPD